MPWHRWFRFHDFIQDFCVLAIYHNRLFFEFVKVKSFVFLKDLVYLVVADGKLFSFRNIFKFLKDFTVFNFDVI